MENPTENRKIMERKSNKARDTLWISTSSDGKFYESQNLPLQRVPGANEDGRTTTRERQRGLDSDIESETTTKMGAVQWRRLRIKGPGRKTKRLIVWCAGEDDEETKVFWLPWSLPGWTFATTSSTTSDAWCVQVGFGFTPWSDPVRGRWPCLLHGSRSSTPSFSVSRETCKLQVSLHLGNLRSHI